LKKALKKKPADAYASGHGTPCPYAWIRSLFKRSGDRRDGAKRLLRLHTPGARIELRYLARPGLALLIQLSPFCKNKKSWGFFSKATVIYKLIIFPVQW
jgi:hypothetical protein